MSISDVGETLRKEGFTDDIVQLFYENKISMPILMDLNKEDFKELGIVALGDRKKLTILIENLKKHVCSF